MHPDILRNKKFIQLFSFDRVLFYEVGTNALAHIARTISSSSQWSKRIVLICKKHSSNFIN